MDGLDIVETSELPDYFYSHATFEDAGSGMVRVVRYAKRKGVLIPVISTVSSAVSLISLGRDAAEFAKKLLMGDMAAH